MGSASFGNPCARWYNAGVCDRRSAACAFDVCRSAALLVESPVPQPLS